MFDIYGIFIQVVFLRSADMCDRNMVYRESAKWTITLQCYQRYTQDMEQHPQPQQSFTPTLKRARQLHFQLTPRATQSNCFHKQQRSSERVREQIRNICRRQTPHAFNNNRPKHQNSLRTATQNPRTLIQHGFRAHAFPADQGFECPKQLQHCTG